MSGMPAERGLAALRQIDPTARLVRDESGWLFQHQIEPVRSQPLPKPWGRDADALMQRVFLVISMLGPLRAGGKVWEFRKGWHHPGDLHWVEVENTPFTSGGGRGKMSPAPGTEPGRMGED